MASTRTHEHGHEHGHDHKHGNGNGTVAAAAPPVVKPSIFICAFPCTGKEKLVEAWKNPAAHGISNTHGYSQVVDLDSTMFPKGQGDNEERLQRYVQHLIDEGNRHRGRIFVVSTHRQVRDGLKSAGKHFGLAYPDPRENLEEEWLNRATAEGGSGLHDYMKANWDKKENITEFAHEDANQNHHRGVALRSGENLLSHIDSLIRKIEKNHAGH